MALAVDRDGRDVIRLPRNTIVRVDESVSDSLDVVCYVGSRQVKIFRFDLEERGERIASPSLPNRQ
jgi:hypothetical protein